MPGELVFLLYDTYGFPADLTADVARERKLVIDEAGFNELMEQQRTLSRSGSKFGLQDDVSIDVETPTEFIGYNHLKGQAKVIALQANSNDVETAEAGSDVVVVLDSSPFYAEGGGQVGDEGFIKTDNCSIEVTDCRKLPNGAFMHIGLVQTGSVTIGETVSLEVTPEARYATAANHSATHLLHAALKKVLGSHVQQKGSMVNPQRLRFDFSHDAPMSADEIAQVEALVNAEVFAQHPVESALMSIDDAKAAGAEALFGEKYGAEVRVISMSDFSLELCGGTHVTNTAEIGLFKIISEAGVAAGVRRLEAVTRRGAMEWANSQQEILRDAASMLKIDASGLTKRIEQLQGNIKTLETDKKKLQQMIASGAGGQDLESQIEQVGDVKVLAALIEGADKDLLRNTIDKFRDKHSDGIIVLGAEVDGKVKLTAGVAKGISKQYPAGKLIQHITALADGRGGGRPDMAEGGIADASKLSLCLDAVKPWVAEQS